MVKRSKCSARWLNERFTEPVGAAGACRRLALAAVFRLEEVDRREKLRQPAAICRDLGAASQPGASYACPLVGQSGRVVAAALPERPVDLDVVLSDMAAKVLKGGGNALIKVFEEAGFQELIRDARGRFAKGEADQPGGCTSSQS